ncbi:MAG: isoleucine--tRNA ligase [Planctomycetota bacterium]|nr:MAG: isoleucine--tRNA ligase [Planctomycetota bacterium]
MLNKAPSNVSFPKLEEDVLKKWEEIDAFQKSIDNREGSKEFTFYDGPPFATGLPHYGHLLAGTIKDIVPRFWTMKGFKVDRVFGWDCHGLPVENEVEKILNISGKKAIDEVGVEAFNNKCREIVLRYTGEWEKTVKRMGRWVDFKKGYKTMDLDFMESIWWVFKQLWDKDLIYKGTKVVPFSAALGTALSNFEAGQNYKDVQDPAITILFKLIDDDAYMAAWTTTPWTLPSNLALCVGPDIDYVKVLDKETGKKIYFAQARLSVYSKKKEFEILETVKGSQLKGLKYEPLFDYFADLAEDGAFQILNDNYVSTDNGTGIVHTAPSFGEDDNRIVKEAGLKLDACPLDNEGLFIDPVTDYKGQFVKDADKLIIRRLKDEGKLFDHSQIVHSYPFCYRTDTPLLYKSISSWYVNVESFKDKLVASNKNIRWVPEYIKEGRFGNWLEGARDWAISRSRSWGTPLPIWENNTNGKRICFGSVEELEKISGKKINDLHREFVDPITFTVDGEEGEYVRVTEVLDCWFESGSMPYAQKHYPFENVKWFEENFPADFIAEGIDQTRGWFYTLVVLGTALFEKNPFKNVIVNGMILAKDGFKMSKSKKNYPPAEDVLNEYGADALRLFLINSPVVAGKDLKFSEEGVKDLIRAVILPLWNSYSFLTTYSHVDGWGPEKGLQKSENQMDQWILSKLQSLIEQVDTEMQNYNLNKVVPPLVDFVGYLTNWYIRLSRRRFWKSENDGDKFQAYSTLYQVLVTFSKVMAPFLPFLTDYIYCHLTKDDATETFESVHLNDFPQPDKSLQNKELELKMDLVRKAVELGRGLRAKHQLKTRQPLQSVTVVAQDKNNKQYFIELNELIKNELNVKEVVVSNDESELVHRSAKPNLKLLGRMYGKQMKEATVLIKELDEETLVSLSSGGTVNILDKELGEEHVLIELSPKEGFVVDSDQGVTVALDTDLNDDLKKEGLARELVNRIQNLRKDASFEVSDKINITLNGDDAINESLKIYGDYLKNETLATNLDMGILPDKSDISESYDIDGIKVNIAVTRN